MILEAVGSRRTPGLSLRFSLGIGRAGRSYSVSLAEDR